MCEKKTLFNFLMCKINYLCTKFNHILSVKFCNILAAMMKKTLIFFALAILLSSCYSRKKITYFQNIESTIGNASINYEPCLKSDDELMIIVSSPDPIAVVGFNLPTVALMNSNTGPGGMTMANAQMQYQTYLVDISGNILFPVIGTIKLGGLTKAEAIDKLHSELVKYVKDPIVNLRIVNYKVSIFGEVQKPGVFNIRTERITLPEVISLAGDMTIYGNRNNVLIIREVYGQKTHNFVDMTQADFINSPYYYLTQNDLVYIEPNKTKINSAGVGPNIAVAISGLSLVITLIVAFAIK